MKLKSEYETIRSSLMSRVSSSSLDECLNELLREEQSQVTQHALKRHVSTPPLEVAYVTNSNSSHAQSTSTVGGLDLVAYAAKGNS